MLYLVVNVELKEHFVELEKIWTRLCNAVYFLSQFVACVLLLIEYIHLWIISVWVWKWSYMSELHYYKVNILFVTLDHYCYAPYKLVGGHLDLQFSVRPYVPKSCVRNFSYTHLWILFILTHSDQLDMKMDFAMLLVLHELWDFVILFTTVDTRYLDILGTLQKMSRYPNVI